MKDEDQQDPNSGTRDALLDSAIRVIARKGLRGATFRAVAGEAGLSHGMIVHYFGSRQALIEAAMDYASKRSLQGAVVPVAGDFGEIGSRLAEVANEDLDILHFRREMQSEARRHAELMPAVVQTMTEMENAVRRQLTAVGVDDERLVVLVAAAMNGLVERQIYIDDQDAVDRAMEALRGFLRLAASSASAPPRT